MALIFRTVEDDLSTVRVDFAAINNNPAATAGFGMLVEMDLSDIDIDVEFIKGSAPGGTPSFTSEGTVDRVYMMEAKHTSFTNLQTLFRTMQAEMRTGGWLEWRPDGASTSLFIKYHPSPIPSMFRGDGFANITAMGQFQVMQFPMIVRQQPYGEGPVETLANAVALTNTVAGMETTVTSTATVPSPCRLEWAVAAAGADVVQIRAAIVSGTSGELTTLAGQYSFEIETADLLGSNTTSVAAVGTASGDAYARVGYTDTDIHKRRWRKEIASMHPGAYHFFPVMKMTTETEQTLQLKSGYRDVDPVDNAGEPLTLDATTATGNPWVSPRLGSVKVPDEATLLVLEAWSRLDEVSSGGTDRLEFDYGVLMPSDETFLTISVMGFGGGAPPQETWKGSDLQAPASPAGKTEGVIHEDTIYLAPDTTDAAAPLPDTGIVLPAGKAIFRASGRLQQFDTSAAQTLGTFVVRNVTGSTDVTTRNLRTKKNRQYTDFSIELVVDTDGTSAYQPQVRAAAATTGTEFVAVEAMSYSFVRTVNNGLKIVVDGADPEQNGIYSGTTKIGDVRISGALPQLQPGANMVISQVLDWSGDAYQNDVDWRGPLAKVVYDRASTITVKTKPQHPL